MGPKGLKTPAHFISGLRPMPKRKNCPRTNEKESRLPGYIAEDDPVLGRPKP